VIFDHASVISEFSRRPKNMSLIHGETKDAVNNRKDFLGKLGVDYRELVCARQIHGDRVKFIDELDKGSGAVLEEDSLDGIDALITDKRNLPLAVFTADCLSVFLFDSKNYAIGLIHAGWRGSQKEITAKTVMLMRGKFNTQSAHLYAGFGPAIRNCCYEVGRDFKEYFAQGVTERDHRNYLDLAEVNKKQLLDLGVKEKNIFDPKICTSCSSDEFFSYRKELSACGRIMSVIMLK